MAACLCCHGPLLRCVRHGDIYWFCSSCWQEMPNAELPVASNFLEQYPQEDIHFYAQSHSGAKPYELSAIN